MIKKNIFDRLPLGSCNVWSSVWLISIWAIVENSIADHNFELDRVDHHWRELSPPIAGWTLKIGPSHRTTCVYTRRYGMDETVNHWALSFQTIANCTMNRIVSSPLWSPFLAFVNRRALVCPIYPDVDTFRRENLYNLLEIG